MTEEKRTRVLEHTGAVNLNVDLTSGVIDVRASDIEGDVAQVTLEPMFVGDEVAVGLIERAEIHMSANAVRVHVPPPPNVGSVVGMQTVYGSNNIVVGNVIGNVVSVGDVYGGITIGGGRGVQVGGAVHIGGSPGQVRVTVTVPTASHVTAKTVSADMIATAVGNAEFAEVVFTSKSGDLTAVGARRVNAHSISGNITADGAEWMHANSTSGDIRAESLAGNLDARSVSGDVRAHAVVDCSITASSVSGDINITRKAGVMVSVDAGSVSGRVRT